MLKGDLVSTPLPDVLGQLADAMASGCLHVLDGMDDEAKVYLRGGKVYAVQVPGRHPQLGARLVSSGSLGPEGLAEALEAQRTELQGWRLGELLVHLGYVDQPVVEAFINEQIRDQTSDLMSWPTGTWKFRVNERTREDVAPPTPVEDLLAEVAQRMTAWETITGTVHGPDAVPVLSAAGQSDAELSIDPEAWSLLCKVDGARSIADLAGECGFTLYEAGSVVYVLVASGLLEVEQLLVGAESTPVGGSVASRLAAAFAPAFEPAGHTVVIPRQAEEPSPAEVANLISAALREDHATAAAPAQTYDEVDASIDRVSAALSALLGPTTDESLFAAPKPRTRKSHPMPPTPAELDRAAKAAAKAERDARRREKDAVELAEAQAELEAARAAEAVIAEAAHSSDHEAEIVNLAEVRRDVARREEELAEAARLTEEARLAEEAARIEAEQAAAAEAEVARLAAEEAARIAAEEAAQIEAEQAAADAEEARRAEEEATRLAAEQAAAAEAEAARWAAEEAARIAAEEAAQVEAEQAAADAEEARRAEEEAAAEEARLEDEEVARLAAEHAAAAEEARRAVEEAERIAAEQAAAEAEQLATDRAAAAARQAEDDAAQALADAENEENIHLAAQRADASSAFAELSATAATAGDVLVEAAPEALVEDVVEDRVDDGVEEQPLVGYRSTDTDMASLFRELTSLGMEDEAPAPARTAPNPARPPSAAVPVKKKKGLFGR